MRVSPSVCSSECKLSHRTGIWTKHLKGKTELHQTVIDRCLKTLMQKQLIKVVKSVKVIRDPFAFLQWNSRALSTRHEKFTCFLIWSQVWNSQVVPGTLIMNWTPNLLNCYATPACGSYRRRRVLEKYQRSLSLTLIVELSQTPFGTNLNPALLNRERSAIPHRANHPAVSEAESNY